MIAISLLWQAVEFTTAVIRIHSMMEFTDSLLGRIPELCMLRNIMEKGMVQVNASLILLLHGDGDGSD